MYRNNDNHPVNRFSPFLCPASGKIKGLIRIAPLNSLHLAFFNFLAYALEAYVSTTSLMLLQTIVG
jgi:hypothetical protein